MSRREESLRLVGCAGLAVLVHIALVPLLPTLTSPDANAAHVRPFQIVRLAAKSQATTAQVAAATVAPNPEPEKPQPEDKLNGQVVDVPPTADDRPPEKYKYLSEYNTRVERETRSRYATPDYQTAMNEPTRRKVPEAQVERSNESRALEVGPENPGEKEKRTGGKQDTAFELPSVQQRDRLALRLDPALGRISNQMFSEGLQGNSERLRLSLGDDDGQPKPGGSAPRTGPTSVELMPTIGVLAGLSGAPANDHLEDLEEGDGTFLNSRQFKYASFFNRMKRGVSQHWRPLDEYRRRDPSGNIYGYRARVTMVHVILDKQGTLLDIEITRSSGVEFLDREAVAAFRRAGPFPNPPHGLVSDNSGTVEFPFGFHVEFTRGGLPSRF